MTRQVLIGVGGSGQHVVLAYLRMMALTVPSPDALPHVFILDADAERGTSEHKRSHVIGDMTALLDSMLRGEGKNERPRFEVFKPYRANAQGGSMTVEQLVGDSESAKRLAQAFLADDDGVWGNDWKVEIQRGMMANPKIGAVALTDKVDGAGDAPVPDADMKCLFACLGESVRVAVVGSSFGGTGSGVIPALMRVLDRKQVAHIRAFMTLPWFAIEQPDEGTSESSAAAARNGVDPQERNATLGLHTYWSTLTGQGGLTRSSYVLSQSMDGWPPARRPDQGNFDQEEHTHVLNLAQAKAIQAYFGMGKGTQPGMLFALRASENEVSGQFNAKTSPHLRLRVEPDEWRQLYDIAADAEATAMVLECGGRVLKSTSKGRMKLPVVHDKLEARDGQLAFVETLRSALGAKKVGIWWWRRIFNSLPREVPEDDVFQKLGSALITRAAEIRQSLLWLDAFVGADGVAGITQLPGGHLFRATDPADFRKGSEPVLDQNALALVWKGLKLVVPSAPEAEVEAQAFTVFTLLFPSGTADNPLVKQFQDALTDKETSKYDLAATVLAVAAHRSVMDLRQGRLHTHRKDSEQRADANAKAASPMLRLCVAGETAQDVRLAAINLEKPPVSGKPPHQFQTEHPRSLKYLDPYIEFASEPKDSFSFDGATLPEHGLRGIPSLVAPILLQRWRASLCQPGAQDEPHGDLRTGDDQGGRRATKLGIYVHAARINEAALWLLASADPRVSFVPDLMDDHEQGESFLAQARSGLASAGLSKLPALVLAPLQAGHGVTPAFLWAGDTWCLAANKRARVFFAKLLRDLPSVQHAYQPNAPLLRRRGAPAGVVDGLHRFFVAELYRLRAQFTHSATPGAVFCQLLDTTLADLPHQPAAQHGDGLTTGVGVATLPVSGAGGQAQITVHAPAVLRDMSKYLLGDTNAPVVIVTTRLAAAGQVQLDLDASQIMLPLRGTIWQQIEPQGNKIRVTRTASKTSPNLLARCRIEELTLQLAGLGPWSIRKPFGERALHLAEELDWSYSVWPPFKAPGWSYYIISAACVGAEASDGVVKWKNPDTDLHFVVYGHLPGQLEEVVQLATIRQGLPVRVHGVPLAIELRTQQQPIGSQPVLLRTCTAHGMSLRRVGIDFGTSNTCVAFEEANASARMLPLLPQTDRDIVFATSEVNTKTARADFLAEVGNCLTARSALVEADEAITIPSELLVGLHDVAEVSRRQNENLTKKYTEESKAYTDIATLSAIHGRPLASPLFAPLPNRRQGLPDTKAVITWLAALVKAGEDRIYGDLKWPQPGDTENLEQSRQLRALYLEAVIVNAFAQLREQGYDEFAAFVATQPEARSGVNDYFAKHYRTDLTQVLSKLCKHTGLRWAEQPQRPHIVSETVAALLMNNLADPNQPHSALTIDIGGGTTDVGVLLKKEQIVGERFTASARFAGNQLLDALVKQPEVRDSLIRDAGGRTDFSDSALAAMLKAKLRNGISITTTERVQAVSHKFFDAVFEYALRVLMFFAQTNPAWVDEFERSDNKVKMKVILLGNGFKLFGQLQHGGGGENELKEFLLGRMDRAVAAGMLSTTLAQKVEFELGTNSKNNLIKVGAFNAVGVNQDGFEVGRTDVLLPGWLVTSGGKFPNTTAEARRVNGATFDEEWLQRPAGGVPKIGLVLRADDEALRKIFPLTLRYWGGLGATEMVQRVFSSFPEKAADYLDIGALYLTGHSGVQDTVCFASQMRKADAP